MEEYDGKSGAPAPDGNIGRKRCNRRILCECRRYGAGRQRSCFSIETGKSVFDVESEFEGVVLAILCEEGDELPIKAPVMVIGQEGETFDARRRRNRRPWKHRRHDKNKRPQPKSGSGSPVAAAASRAGRRLSSPRARALADKAGVDPQLAQPTGAEGLIIERDVKALLDARQIRRTGRTGCSRKPQRLCQEYKDIPLSMMRKTIAKAMFGPCSPWRS